MNRAVNTMMLLVSIYAALTIEVSTKTILCHTDNHEYFHKQYGRCLPCEKCNPGEEQMNIDEWVSSKPQSVFTKYGPTQCPECVTCRSGFFNNGRAFECKRCKNCTLYNKHEVEPCTSITDTECDGVLTNEGSSVVAKSGTSSIKDHNEIHPGSIIAISILLTIIVTLCLILARSWYKRSKRRQKNSEKDVEDGSSVPLILNNRSIPIQRTRHNSEPSSYSSERKVSYIQRHFSDPGDGHVFDVEVDGDGNSDSSGKRSYSFDVDKGVTGPSISFDKKKMDKECLISLSKQLCEKSRCFPFARTLGLSDANIDTIKHDYDRNGLSEVSYQVLAELQKCGKLVYKEQAVKTLREMGLSHMIEKIKS